MKRETADMQLTKKVTRQQNHAVGQARQLTENQLYPFLEPLAEATLKPLVLFCHKD